MMICNIHFNEDTTQRMVVLCIIYYLIFNSRMVTIHRQDANTLKYYRSTLKLLFQLVVKTKTKTYSTCIQWFTFILSCKIYMF